jgi:phage terminase small subunit
MFGGMRSHGLTPRQEIFAQHYALCGNGTKAAIRAGCNPASARTRASKWLAKDHIRRSVEEIRNRAFRQLRHQVAQEILTAVEQGIQSSINLRRTQRGLALANRIKLYAASESDSPADANSRQEQRKIEELYSQL